MPALAGITLLVGFALAFPVAIVFYWMAAGGSSGLPATVSIGAATGYTLLYSAAGALIAMVLALPVSLLAARHQRRWSWGSNAPRSSSGHPGVVIGLALVYLGSRYLGSLYQSPEMLVAAYTVMFFPSAWSRSPPRCFAPHRGSRRQAGPWAGDRWRCA